MRSNVARAALLAFIAALVLTVAALGLRGRGDGWRTSTVAGLSVQAPAGFQETRIPVPREMRMAVRRLDVHETRGDEVQVVVSRTVYQDGVPVNVGGAVRESSRQFEAAAGVRDALHQSAVVRVAGVPAVRTTTTFSADGEPGRAQALAFARGQTLWQVQAVYPDTPSATAAADRVIQSVALAPQP